MVSGTVRVLAALRLVITADIGPNARGRLGVARFQQITGGDCQMFGVPKLRTGKSTIFERCHEIGQCLLAGENRHPGGSVLSARNFQRICRKIPSISGASRAAKFTRRRKRRTLRSVEVATIRFV